MKKFIAFLLALGLSFALFWGMGPASAIFKDVNQADTTSGGNKMAEKHFQKAIALLKQTNYQEAISEYEEVIKLLPKSDIALDAQYWIGQSYFRMGQHEEALSVFEKLIEKYPESAIVPVTQLMMARVEQAKENQKLNMKRDAALDKKIVIDPKTGVKFSKIEILSGKKDVAVYSHIKLSPNGKFLLHQKIVIPLKGEEPFDLVDTEAWRGIWSPDGKKVAFYSGDAICVIPVSPETGRPTGPVKKLLEGKYRFIFPVSWSPDSERIVFMRRDEKIKGDIWTLSLKDGSLKEIAGDPEVEMNPVWSPDGKTIAYNWADSEIRVVPAEGGTSKKIADVKYGRYISWSPDGKWLFYKAMNKSYLYRLSDERVFEIASPEEVGAFFSWSSDGRKMLFYRTSYDFTNVLKVVSASGGPSFQLGRELKLSPYNHYWSPDNRVIITHGKTKSPDDSGLWMIPLAGTEAIPLKLDDSFNGKVHPLALSPDCERLLFYLEQPDGKESLYYIPVSLKEGRTIGPPVDVFSEWDGSRVFDNWSWSPNGQKLAVIHKDDIWAMSIKKGKPIQITKTSESEILPEWSPDGKKLVYVVALENGIQHLHVISASGGETNRILDECAYWSHAWSPGSKEIVAESEEIIVAIPIDGSKGRTILDLKQHNLNGASGLCWLPDDKNLAFIS
ncbi:MAG: DPP IV N-terminal domain-containing protein, partial [Candidatus Aminicenantaceae bacterium]